MNRQFKLKMFANSLPSSFDIKIIAFQELHNALTELQNNSGVSSARNESFITNLNTTIQEKDDMINNLKNELNNNIEKVTKLIEDNKSLSDQIILKEEQAKGHADDVIKELGEVSVNIMISIFNTKYYTTCSDCSLCKILFPKDQYIEIIPDLYVMHLFLFSYQKSNSLF